MIRQKFRGDIIIKTSYKSFKVSLHEISVTRLGDFCCLREVIMHMATTFWPKLSTFEGNF